jgi:hypothetical protein
VIQIFGEATFDHHAPGLIGGVIQISGEAASDHRAPGY